MEFHDWALSIGKVFRQESTVVKWNYQILSLHLVRVCQKVPILDFQSEFSMSKIIRIFLKKIFIEEYQFRHTFFCKKHFCWLLFQNHFITKIMPNFWRTDIWLQLIFGQKSCYLGPRQFLGKKWICTSICVLLTNKAIKELIGNKTVGIVLKVFLKNKI